MSPDALFSAVAEAILEREVAGMGATFIPSSAEGLILHRVARHDGADIRPVLELVVRGSLI